MNVLTTINKNYITQETCSTLSKIIITAMKSSYGQMWSSYMLRLGEYIAGCARNYSASQWSENLFFFFLKRSAIYMLYFTFLVNSYIFYWVITWKQMVHTVITMLILWCFEFTLIRRASPNICHWRDYRHLCCYGYTQTNWVGSKHNWIHSVRLKGLTAHSFKLISR